MLIDPYAVLHALVRAEALRSTKPKPKPEPEPDPDSGEHSRPAVPSDRDHD